MQKLFLVLGAVLFLIQGRAQNVGIGTTIPDTSAIIELKSTNKGILIPRITEAARLQIVDPAAGLLVFQTGSTANSMSGFYYFDGSDDQWYRIGTSKQIGIGTENPRQKAILDIQSTSQGVLFPTLTTAQRNAISNPPNGLHIFNADEKCLNFYDAVNQVWNCYCADCKTAVINITASVQDLDFYELVKNNPSPNYLVNISAGVTVSASAAGGDALLFTNMTFPAAITINNYGTIAGAGGAGGKGNVSSYVGGVTCLGSLPTIGQGGGDAIATKPGVAITVRNYGVIAGGGGGGNPGVNGAGYAGGGGGGAGSIPGNGGSGAGYYSAGQFLTCALNTIGTRGTDGSTTTGGGGGAGANGGTAGSAGGARGAAGAGGGGAAGKAISGGSGNSITNLSGGQYFGGVD